MVAFNNNGSSLKNSDKSLHRLKLIFLLVFI